MSVDHFEKKTTVPAAMTDNAIREALEPISKIAEFFADEQEWRDHDTIMVAPMENLREAQHLTVGDLRRARAAYDAIGSEVKAEEGWIGPVEPRRMAEGCCSAISPCGHQQRDPYSICDVCTRAAEAGPVGEAVAWQSRSRVMSHWGPWTEASEAEFVEYRNNPEAYPDEEARPLFARPVEPDEVERIKGERNAWKSVAQDGAELHLKDYHRAERETARADAAEAALAETRGLIRDAIGLVPLAHQNWHTDARAALTGEAAR